MRHFTSFLSEVNRPFPDSARLCHPESTRRCNLCYALLPRGQKARKPRVRRRRKNVLHPQKTQNRIFRRQTGKNALFGVKNFRKNPQKIAFLRFFAEIRIRKDKFFPRLFSLAAKKGAETSHSESVTKKRLFKKAPFGVKNGPETTPALPQN